jgi:hypothetical protein
LDKFLAVKTVCVIAVRGAAARVLPVKLIRGGPAEAGRYDKRNGAFDKIPYNKGVEARGQSGGPGFVNGEFEPYHPGNINDKKARQNGKYKAPEGTGFRGAGPSGDEPGAKGHEEIPEKKAPRGAGKTGYASGSPRENRGAYSPGDKVDTRRCGSQNGAENKPGKEGEKIL